MALRHNLTDRRALPCCIQLPFALGVALLIRGNMPGRALFRTIFFLPYVLSEVITAVVWVFIFRPQNGLMNSDPRRDRARLRATRHSWAITNTVLYAIFVVITWKFFGFHMILYLAGLQSIPSESRGRGPRRRCAASTTSSARHHPAAARVRRSASRSSSPVLGSLQFFDLIWVMTKGGPVNASNTMATYMYTFGFQRFQLGYGAAASLVIFMICFVFSLLYQRFVMRRDLEGALTWNGHNPCPATIARNPRPHLAPGPWPAMRLRELLIAAVVLMPLVVAVARRAFEVQPGFAVPGPVAYPATLHHLQLHRHPATWPFWQKIINSVIVMLLTTTISRSGALERGGVRHRPHPVRGREPLFNFFVLGLLFPLPVAILPLYLLLRQLGLVDSLWGVILPQVAFSLPFNILLLRIVLRGGAARSGGCRVCRRGGSARVPLAHPAAAGEAGPGGGGGDLTMVKSWNNFFLPLVVLNSENVWTPPAGRQQFQGQYHDRLGAGAGLRHAGDACRRSPSTSWRNGTSSPGSLRDP